MKYKSIILVFFLMASGTAASTQSAEYKLEQAPFIKGTTHPMGEALVKDIMNRAEPSKAQNVDILSLLQGTWSYTATVWTAPGEKPYQTVGSITNELILDNRFMSGSEKGELNIGGHNVLFKGQGLIGFDNTRKIFTSVWINSLSTAMIIGSGTFDAKGKKIEITGKFINPLNGAEEKFRSETLIKDSDHYSRIIFTTGKSEKEFKLMEFDYSRKSR